MELSKLNKKNNDSFSFYWGRKSADTIKQIIDSYPEDTLSVLDPFLGSGTTLYGSLKSNKNIDFIGVELNQMPIEQIKFNLEKLDHKLIGQMSTNLESFIKDMEYLYFYEIENFEIFIEKVYLNRDGEKIKPTSFDVVLDGTKSKINQKNSLFNELSKKYLKRNEDISKKIRKISLDENTRIAIKKGMYLSDIFSSINFYILDEYKSYFYENKEMIFLVSTILHSAKYTDTKYQSQYPYWFPKNNIVDRNVLMMLDKKLKSLIQFSTNNQLNNENMSTNYRLYNKSILDISDGDIPNSSINMIITDPPYYDQIAYSEYLKIWEHFTGYKSFLDKEIVVSNRKNSNKDKENYLRMIGNAFTILEKKLKQNGKMYLFFKDTDLVKLNLFLESVEKSGFILTDSFHVSSKKKTYKQNTSPKGSLIGETIFLFIKGVNIDKSKQYITDLDKELYILFDTYLKKHPNGNFSKFYSEYFALEMYNRKLLSEYKNSRNVIDIILKKYIINESKGIFELNES